MIALGFVVAYFDLYECSYRCRCQATYVSQESERHMSITRKLARPLPQLLLKVSAPSLFYQKIDHELLR